MPPRMMPAVGEAVLLPFKNKIIYDGIFKGHDTVSNPLPLEEINLFYQDAKRKWGTTLTLG